MYRVSHRVNGRVMITNYDPAVLSNAERFQLHGKAEEAPANDVLIDIRPGFPGGEFPIRGRLRLRSFHEVLTFVGRGIAEEREYPVRPDPRTPKLAENPAVTLDIVESRRVPRDAGPYVLLRGQVYTIRSERGYQWNHKAFSMLYQLFQMSLSSNPQTGPAITIAK